MKKDIIKEVLTKVNHIAMTTAKQSVNSTCIYIHHQPKVPESANKFKRV